MNLEDYNPAARNAVLQNTNNKGHQFQNQGFTEATMDRQIVKLCVFGETFTEYFYH